VLLSLLVVLLPESPFHLLGDEHVEEDDEAEQPPVTSEPDDPQHIEQSPETEPCPTVVVELLPAHIKLLYRVDDSLECLRIIHGKVRQHLTVETDVLLGEFTHKLRIRETVLTCGGVDSLDPKRAEIALLGTAVTVCVGETFLVGVLRNRPNIPSRQEVATGSFEDLLAARPGGD